jgi:S1-C subfamily serine protease
VRYAYLGISSVAVYPQLAERFDLGTTEGAWVQQVSDDGPADDAGLEAGEGDERFQAREYAPGGDVITRVEGRAIRTENDLGLTLTRFAPGDEVTLEVVRDGERRTLEVTLGERPLEVAPQQP